MPRSRWSRLLSAVFAVWLALVMGEAGFVHHRCPMHDGAMPGQTATHAPAHMAHPASADADAGNGAPTNAGHHVCTCIGACNAACGALPLPTPGELALIVLRAAAAAPAISPTTAAAATPVPFALPFANAPPRAIA